MRIVNRETFLSLPRGTVFAKWEPCCFEDLCILTSVVEVANVPIDFRYTSLVDSLGDPEGSKELPLLNPIDVLLALDAGAEVPTDFAVEIRDGVFDQEQRFAVWSADDVQRLIARLLLALRG